MPAPPPSPPRSRPWLVPVLFALLAVAGVVTAIAAVQASSEPATKRMTVRRTVTRRGTTSKITVTTTAPTTTLPDVSGSELAAQGYAKMQRGDYQGALPLLEQGVHLLAGTGTHDEAYADYNLAYTRYVLGECTNVLALLTHSQTIQGHRTEIDTLRRKAQSTCG